MWWTSQASVDPPETMDVVCHQVVLNESAVFRLVLRHNAEVSIIQARCQLGRSSASRVLGTFGSDDLLRHSQSRGAVDAAPVHAPTLLVVGVLIDDFVAEEPCGLCPRVRDQGFLV